MDCCKPERAWYANKSTFIPSQPGSGTQVLYGFFMKQLTVRSLPKGFSVMLSLFEVAWCILPWSSLSFFERVRGQRICISYRGQCIIQWSSLSFFERMRETKRYICNDHLSHSLKEWWSSLSFCERMIKTTHSAVIISLSLFQRICISYQGWCILQWSSLSFFERMRETKWYILQWSSLSLFQRIYMLVTQGICCK